MASKKPAPKTDRHERTRELVLAAARELVLEAGADALSLRKVAERARFSPASLYEYFDGKDEILRVLAERVVARLDASMAQVPSSLAPLLRLVRYGQAYVRFARENREDFLLLFVRLRSKRMATAQPVEGGSPYGRILDAAREGIALGVIDHRDPETVAYGLWGTAHGLAMLQLTHLEGFAIDFETVDAEVLRTHVEGLRP